MDREMSLNINIVDDFQDIFISMGSFGPQKDLIKGCQIESKMGNEVMIGQMHLLGMEAPQVQGLSQGHGRVALGPQKDHGQGRPDTERAQGHVLVCDIEGPVEVDAELVGWEGHLAHCEGHGLRWAWSLAETGSQQRCEKRRYDESGHGTW